MPTLEECVNQHLIAGLPTTLTRWNSKERMIYAGRSVFFWVRDVLPHLVTEVEMPEADSPKAQYEALLRNFVAGRPFDPPTPHPMNPELHGIWRLRTEDVRLIGWFPRRNIFVVAEAVDKKTTLQEGFDEALLSRALSYRTRLNLDGGRFLLGSIEELTHVD